MHKPAPVFAALQHECSRFRNNKSVATLDGVLAVNDHDGRAVAGLMSFGLVKVANYVARPYLESGQLTQVLTDWTADQLPISVLYPQSRHLSAKVRIFLDATSLAPGAERHRSCGASVFAHPNHRDGGRGLPT